MDFYWFCSFLELIFSSNILDAVQIRKDESNEELLENSMEAGWSVVHFPVEVRYRGFMEIKLKW